MKYFICNCFYELKLGCGVVNIKRLITEDFIDFHYLTFVKNDCFTFAVRKQLHFCLIVIAILIFSVLVQVLMSLSVVLNWLSLVMKIFVKSVKNFYAFILVRF